MPYDVQRLLRLWTEPLPEDDGAAAGAVRELYADPVVVNGAPLPATDLVARARRLQAALEDAEHDVLAVADTGGTVAVVFRLGGRQVGPLDTPAGALPATGARVDLRIIDVLTLVDGRIGTVWTIADWVPVLTAAGVVRALPSG
jgi:predicted ester cyclase